MSEHEPRDEERVASRLYRQLPREEPPAYLDAAVRDEARRLGNTHPAPLVTPTGRRSWHYPVAAAAVIMLAVAVTWHVEREQPDSVAPSSAPVAAAPTAPVAAETQGKKQDKAPREMRARRDASPQFTPEPPPPEAKADVPTQPQSRQADSAGAATDSMSQRAERAPQAMRAPADNRLAKLAEPPERWLERIAGLRMEGRHDEADVQLAEFRKRHPDFRISDEMLKKVEKEK